MGKQPFGANSAAPSPSTAPDNSWMAAYTAAYSGSTVLDDPIALEDKEIYLWLRGHQLPPLHYHLPKASHGRYILGSTMLPAQWMAQTVQFANLEDTRGFINALEHSRTAMQIVSDVLFKVDGAMLCESVQAMLQRLALYLVQGCVWLMPLHKPQQPDIGSTSPDVYNGLNQLNQTSLDISKLSAWEGGQYLRGYVPFTTKKNAQGKSEIVVAGQSGMTIATGYDLGQRTQDEVKAVTGLSTQALTALLPFVGVRFAHLSKAQVIAKVVTIGPVPVIEKSDADALDRAVGATTLSATIAAWIAHRKTNVPTFTQMPAPWQTVMFSRTYNQGPGWALPGSSTYAFFKAAAEGKWKDAVKALNDAPGPGWFQARVKAEAAYLTTGMPKELPAPPQGKAASGPPAATPATTY